MNAYIVGYDAQMVIDKFLKMKETSSLFHFDYYVNDEQQLSRLFWCDPINKKSYLHFGDVVTADATYRKNRYVYNI